MKRLTLLFALLFTITAHAQPRPPAGPPPGGPQGGPPPDARRLADYLGLTTDQKAAWQAAQKEFDDAAKPLFDKQRDVHEQLDALLDAKSTDACAVGALMLQMRSIGDQIKTLHDAAEAKKVAVLSAEQKAKYEAFQAAASFLRQPPGPPR